MPVYRTPSFEMTAKGRLRREWLYVQKVLKDLNEREEGSRGRDGQEFGSMPERLGRHTL
jgi:hypothetical protein